MNSRDETPIPLPLPVPPYIGIISYHSLFQLTDKHFLSPVLLILPLSPSALSIPGWLSGAVYSRLVT